MHIRFCSVINRCGLPDHLKTDRFTLHGGKVVVYVHRVGRNGIVYKGVFDKLESIEIDHMTNGTVVSPEGIDVSFIKKDMVCQHASTIGVLWIYDLILIV